LLVTTLLLKAPPVTDRAVDVVSSEDLIEDDDAVVDSYGSNGADGDSVAASGSRVSTPSSTLTIVLVDPPRDSDAELPPLLLLLLLPGNGAGKDVDAADREREKDDDDASLK
jgi:hypothetical protein